MHVLSENVDYSCVRYVAASLVNRCSVPDL